MEFFVEETEEGYRAFCSENPAVYFLGRSYEEALGEAVKGNRKFLQKLGVSIHANKPSKWNGISWPDRLRFWIGPEKQLLAEIKRIMYEDWLKEPSSDLFYKIKKAVEAVYGPVFEIDSDGRSVKRNKPR